MARFSGIGCLVVSLIFTIFASQVSSGPVAEGDDSYEDYDDEEKSDLCKGRSDLKIYITLFGQDPEPTSGSKLTTEILKTTERIKFPEKAILERLIIKNEPQVAPEKDIEKSRDDVRKLAEPQQVEDSSIIQQKNLAIANKMNQISSGKLLSAVKENIQTTTTAPITRYTNPTVLFKVDESLFKDMSADELSEMLEGSNHQPIQPVHQPAVKKSQKPGNKIASLLPALLMGLAAREKSSKNQAKEREQEMHKTIGRIIGSVLMKAL